MASRKPAAPSKSSAKTKPAAAKSAAAKPSAANKKAAAPAPAGEKGLGAETLEFLAGIEAHNEKGWFEEHRAEHDLHYKQAGVELVEALGPKLAKLVPGLSWEARQGASLARIHRDIRFSKDKRPYKDHLTAWFWTGDLDTAPGLFLRLTAKHAMTGAGVWHFDDAQLAAFRAAVLDDTRGAALAKLLAKAQREGASLNEPERARVPKGLPADHPRAELLKLDGIRLFQEWPLGKLVPGTAPFLDRCVEAWSPAAPLVKWLAETFSG